MTDFGKIIMRGLIDLWVNDNLFLNASSFMQSSASNITWWKKIFVGAVM